MRIEKQSQSDSIAHRRGNALPHAPSYGEFLSRWESSRRREAIRFNTSDNSEARNTDTYYKLRSAPPSFGDYSCRASFSYPEYFSVFSASFTVIFLFGLAYSLIFPSETVSFSGTSLERILSAVLLIAVPAVMEEYLIRRLIAGKLAVYNQSAAIIISALIFALMHYSAEKFPYTFVSGVAAA